MLSIHDDDVVQKARALNGLDFIDNEELYRDRFFPAKGEEPEGSSPSLSFSAYLHADAELRQYAEDFEKRKGYPVDLALWEETRGYVNHRKRILCQFERIGDTFRVRKNYQFQGKIGGGRKRGKVSEFSIHASQRLKERIGGIDLSAYAKERLLLVTLTYPQECKDGITGKGVKDALRKWFQCIERELDCGIVWKLEFTRKGLPHVHLLLLLNEEKGIGVNDNEKGVYEGIRGLSRIAWVKVNDFKGEVKEKAMKASTSVEYVKNPKALPHYLGDYLADCGKRKDYQNASPAWFSGVGRWWGVKGRDKIAWVPKESKEISVEEARTLSKFMESHLKSKNPVYSFKHEVRKVLVTEEEDKAFFDHVFENVENGILTREGGKKAA